MFRTFLATITLAAPAIVVAPLPSHAQSDYPYRIVKIVVPYGAGTAAASPRGYLRVGMHDPKYARQKSTLIVSQGGARA